MWWILIPIYLNFPISCRCVLKAIIHRKNSELFYSYLRRVFLFQKETFYDIVHAWNIWLQSIIYVAADNALARNHFGNLESANIDLTVSTSILFMHSFKKKLYGPFLWIGFSYLKARTTSRRQFTLPLSSQKFLLLILPTFNLVHSMAWPYPNQVYDKQRSISQWWFVCFVCHVLKYFFPKMVFSSILLIVPIFFSCYQSWWQSLVNTRLTSQFLENVSSLDFLPNALFPHQSITDCTAQTLLTKTLNTTKFIEVTSHTETFSIEKEPEKQLCFYCWHKTTWTCAEPA